MLRMNRTFRSALAGMVAAAALLAAPLGMPPAAAASLTAEDRADLDRVERYLNGITSMRSNFLQASSTGLVARGKVWLRRPGRMRFEYDPPSAVLITSDGILVTFQDLELQQTNQVPLLASPLRVLVDSEVSFERDLLVEEVRKEANVLRITARLRRDPDQGSVTLTFQDQPLSLKQWTIVDAQQVSIRVALLDPEFGVDVANALFRPKDFGRQSDQLGR